MHALTDAGEPEASDAALRDARAASDQAGGQVGIDLLHYVAGRLRAAQGRHEHALEELMTCGRRQAAWGILAPLALWRGEAARALVGLDRREEARALAAEEVEVARAWGESSRQHAMALRALAAVSEGDEAVALPRSSAELLAVSPARLERARTLLELGSALRRGGERTAARGLEHRARVRRVPGRGARARRAERDRRAPAQDPARRRRRAHPERAAHRRAGRRGAEQPRHRGHAVRHGEDRRGAPRARHRKLGITGRAGLERALSRDSAPAEG